MMKHFRVVPKEFRLPFPFIFYVLSASEDSAKPVIRRVSCKTRT